LERGALKMKRLREKGEAMPCAFSLDCDSISSGIPRSGLLFHDFRRDDVQPNSFLILS